MKLELVTKLDKKNAATLIMSCRQIMTSLSVWPVLCNPEVGFPARVL